MPQKTQKFKDLFFGTWFVFAGKTKEDYPTKYIKISDRRYVAALSLGKGGKIRKSTIHQIGSVNIDVRVIPKGWG